jgi:hypothetical protein
MSLDPKEEDWFFKSVHNIKIHQFSNIIQITKDILHPIAEIFPKFRGRVCILCMVFYNPKTRKYFSSLDPYPIRKFQLVLNNLVSEYDAETLHHTEKLKHHLNISPQVQLFTRIFKKPAVFEYPTNYVITGTKLNIHVLLNGTVTKKLSLMELVCIYGQLQKMKCYIKMDCVL